MRTFLKENKGFTLIEMLIVLMIISVLLLIAVPQMNKSRNIVNEKSCQATIELIQSQVEAYQVSNDGLPADLTVLKTDGYIDTVQCPGGTPLILNNGVVEKDLSSSGS